MPNSRIPQHAIRDSLGKRYWPFFTGRDKARTPMQWNNGLNAGFSKTKPWLPVDDSYREINVETESQDEKSLFQVYKNMIHLRKKHPALQMGRWVPLLNGKNGVAILLRFLKDERIIILLNFTGQTIKIDIQEHLFGEVLFSTHRSTVEVKYLKGLRVLPFEATVLLDSAYSRFLADGSHYDD
jgi:alpha-glucosidase